MPGLSATATSFSEPPVAKTVLLVEDNSELREATHELLEMFGNTVMSVGTAAEARLHLLHQQFHVLVSDVRLGRDNGVELAHGARRLQPDIGLLLLSGDALPNDAPGLPPGCQFLRKPYDFDELEEALQIL